VVKTQGRRGEVAVEVHSSIVERFQAGLRLFALPSVSSGSSGESRREVEVEELWPHKEWLVLKFVGVDSISQAEDLIGCELQVPGIQRAALEAGWTYVSDLVGCSVLDHGREIGRVEDVQFGAGEAPLLIVVDSGGKKFDVPFAEAYLEGVDVALRQVRMKLPDGMLEVNAPLTAEEKLGQTRVSRKRQ
jgi:16S rRNA processing protein RimM